VFGAARPREEVLKERGVDPLEVEGLAERQRLSEGSLAHHSGGSFKHGGSRGGSMLGSEGDDEWHTVGGGARRGRGSASGEPSLLSDVGGFRADPFFGGGGSGGRQLPPPAKGFASYEERGGSGHWQGHGRHSGSYGSPAVGGGYMERAAGGYAAVEEEEEDAGVGVFARGLPTRHSLLL
jgi:collagen type III alpha